MRSELARGEPGRDATCVIKVIFAENELHAEDMLNRIRAPVPNSQDVATLVMMAQQKFGELADFPCLLIVQRANIGCKGR